MYMHISTSKCFIIITVFIVTLPSYVKCAEYWKRYTNCVTVADIVVSGDDIWAATNGGVVRWNISDASYEIFDATDGLISKSWLDKVQTIDIDSHVYIWCALRFGGLARYALGNWSMVTTAHDYNDIRSCAMDSNDIMWFHTYYELYRYDRHTWKNYPDEFEEVTIKAVCVDDNDNAWVADNKNIIHRFDDDIWMQFPFEFDKGCGGINDLLVDHNGVLWVVSDLSCGMHPLHSYDKGRWRSYPMEEIGATMGVSAIAVDNENILWLGSGNGVIKFDGIEWQSIGPEDLYGVTAIYVDDNDVKYFGTSNNSVWSFDGGNWRRYTNDKKLSSNLVNTINVDKTNVKWFGTREGLLSFDGNDFIFHMSGDISSVEFTSENTVWMIRSHDLWSFDGMSWKRYDEPHLAVWDEDYLRSLVQDIYVDSQDRLWVVAENSISSFDGEDWTIHCTVNPDVYNVHIIEDHNKNIWVCTGEDIKSFDGNVWTSYKDAVGDWCNKTLSMAVDLQNIIWFGTTDGIYYYDENSWRFFDYDVNFVTDIIVDLYDTKWFIAYSDILRYDDSAINSYIDEPELNGLNSFNSPVIDRSNHLWVNTEDGVVRYNGYTWTHYTVADGLADNIVNDIVVDENNVKWFATEYWGACSFEDGTPVAVNETAPYPESVSVIDNRPNPFNPMTTLTVTLPMDGKVVLIIYNISGQKVRDLYNGNLHAGMHSYIWDGRNNSSVPVSSGIYIARLQCRDSNYYTKMMLVK